jgi:hypothetical protein
MAFAREAALELLLLRGDELGSLDKVRQVLDLQGIRECGRFVLGSCESARRRIGCTRRRAGGSGRACLLGVFGAVSLYGGQPVIVRAGVCVSA